MVLGFERLRAGGDVLARVRVLDLLAEGMPLAVDVPVRQLRRREGADLTRADRRATRSVMNELNGCRLPVP